METRTRSLLKALSWRIIALTITSGLGYLFTGSVAFAASLGFADSAIKIIAYYLHERTWNNVDIGRNLSEHEATDEASRSSQDLAIDPASPQ